MDGVIPVTQLDKVPRLHYNGIFMMSVALLTIPIIGTFDDSQEDIESTI